MMAQSVSPCLAFVFPGQGSQSVGMLNKLAEAYPTVFEMFSEASELLGFNLWDIVQNGPDSELNRTEITQPAMFVADVAVWRIWESQTTREPGWMAGHSLGEYAALTCAGAIEFADALKLVALRAQLMQDCVPNGVGAMAAILGLDDPEVARLCEANAANDEVLAPVNYNSPGQVVIAGHKAAVDRAVGNAKAAGAKKAVLLPVSVPSHCELMQPAAAKLQAYLSDVVIAPPRIPVIHNVDVASHMSPDFIRCVLAQQIHCPVRWSDTIRFLSEQGVTQFVECGPGKVLTGLGKRIADSATWLPITDPESLATAQEAIA